MLIRFKSLLISILGCFHFYVNRKLLCLPFMFLSFSLEKNFFLKQDIKSMTMLCPDHLGDAGHLGK